MSTRRSHPRITINKNGTVVVRGITASDWSCLATKISLHCYDSEKEWATEKLDRQKTAADYEAKGDKGMADVVRDNIRRAEEWHREMRRISDLLNVEFKALRE